MLPANTLKRKKLHHGASHTETTWATLGTIDYLNRIKRDAMLRSKVEKVEKTEEDEAMACVNEISHDDIDKMNVPGLQEAQKERGLRWTGLKKDLQNCLKNLLNYLGVRGYLLILRKLLFLAMS